jgi:hypothetical protein
MSQAMWAANLPWGITVFTSTEKTGGSPTWIGHLIIQLTDMDDHEACLY